jgi:hypothetical protein
VEELEMSGKAVAGPGFNEGCFHRGAVVFCMVLGTFMTFRGYENFYTALMNGAVRPAALAALAARPPGRPAWLRVEGVLVPGSLTGVDRARFILLSDPGSKAALFVRLAKGSRIPDQTGAAVLEGMVRPASGGQPEVRGAPAGSRIVSLVLEEKARPPSWWWSGSIAGLGVWVFLAGFCQWEKKLGDDDAFREQSSARCPKGE